MINRSVRHVVEFGLEIKDEALQTGDLVEITIPEIVDIDGAADSRIFLVIKKQLQRLGTAIYKAIDTGFGDHRYCLISDDTNVYDSSTYDKDIYGWISDGNNKCGAADDGGYYIF